MDRFYPKIESFILKYFTSRTRNVKRSPVASLLTLLVLVPSSSHPAGRGNERETAAEDGKTTGLFSVKSFIKALVFLSNALSACYKSHLIKTCNKKRAESICEKPHTIIIM